MTRNISTTVYIVFLIIAAGFGVGAAMEAKVLIPAAFPFAAVLVGLLFWLNPKAELIAWTSLTVGILAGTYVTTGNPIEYVVYLAYIVLAALGLFKSPYFLAAAWLFHPIWDFLPRTLPEKSHDLPVACIIFDLPIGLYLLYGSVTKRWSVFADEHTRAEWIRRTVKLLWVTTLILGGSFAIAGATGKGYINWMGLATAAVLIVAFRVLKPRTELLAFAFLTGWLGMSYAHTGGLIDALFFFAYVALSAYGAFGSTYALAFAWFVFVPWSFLPHHRHHMPPDLLTATFFYCIPIGAYLVWGSRQKRWSPVGKDDSNASLGVSHA